MPDPQYWTVVGFKTLEELQANVEHCAELVRYAQDVEDSAARILLEAQRLVRLRDDLQVERLKTRLLPPPRPGP